MAATDKEMLEALLVVDKLGDEEEDAFRDMLHRLRQGYQKELTSAQRSWVKGRYLHFELDADEGALNLVSSGKVAKTKVVLPYESLPRPVKPPGRV